MMTKQEAIDFIYSSYLRAEKYIPYEEKDALRRSPDLLKDYLNDEAFSGSTNILVTGSKGKGSTARFIAALISGAISTSNFIQKDNEIKACSEKEYEGLDLHLAKGKANHDFAVGLVTSPEVLDFTDRIQIVKSVPDTDGKIITSFSKIPDEDFIKEISEIFPIIEKTDSKLPKDKYVSPIGEVALTAQKYFCDCRKNNMHLNAQKFSGDNVSNTEKSAGRDCQISYKVFECGKGARYDDTNRIKHEIAVITPIFLEHKRELGDTIEEIAEDKSCIVTSDVKYCISGKQDLKAAKIIEEKCKSNNTECFFYGRDFEAKNIEIKDGKTHFAFVSKAPIEIELKNLSIPLLGDFQAENAAVALETAIVTMAFSKSAEAVNEILSSISYPGRLELIRKNPTVIIDNTINRTSAMKILPILKALADEKYYLVLSIPNDKDFLGVIDALSGIVSKVFIMPLKNPHYKIDATTEKEVIEQNLKNNAIDITEISIDEIQLLLNNLKTPIVFCGVTAMVKEVHEALSTAIQTPD